MLKIETYSELVEVFRAWKSADNNVRFGQYIFRNHCTDVEDFEHPLREKLLFEMNEHEVFANAIETIRWQKHGIDCVQAG